MRKTIKIQILMIPLILLFLLSCSRDEIQGRESLIGRWEVTEVTSFYGDFTENGGGPLDVQEERGNLGFFEFSRGTVVFDFTRDGERIQAERSYTLDLGKVREGFFRTNAFALRIADSYEYECQFEDGTRNAEKDASYFSLYHRPTEIGPGVAFLLRLDRR